MEEGQVADEEGDRAGQTLGKAWGAEGGQGTDEEGDRAGQTLGKACGAEEGQGSGFRVILGKTCGEEGVQGSGYRVDLKSCACRRKEGEGLPWGSRVRA